MDWIDELKDTFPDLLKTEEIGKTHEGKSIIAVHLSSDKGSDKPRLVYNALQHAREWITLPTITYMLNELVQGYGKNETLTELVDKIDWTFIPIVNVDGYDFTWDVNRNWRKTRKPNNDSSCIGVDPNRNWPYMWNRGGSSNNPCSETYHGPFPGSEVEPMAVINYVKRTQRVMGYADIHCCGQMFMSPWGYTHTLPSDYDKMLGLMNPVVEAIRSIHGRVYRAGNIADVIYVASGSSADYIYGELGIVYSFAVELRNGVPPSEIRQQGDEFFAGIVVMANAIKNEYYKEK